MKRIWLFILAGLLLLTGLGILLYPNLNRLAAGFTDQEKIVHFREEQKETDGEDAPYADLLTQMQDYNKEIYENGQEDLKDVWSYEQNPFDFDTAGLADDMIGYITIDAMDEEMPLYIGANEGNMSKGAVVMGQTSMPIGGENTNCVIAAHRGYRGIPMFQYIEDVQVGDPVILTNLWETLVYRVSEIKVIDPSDIREILIRPGEDMVTLFTCHPYTHNYQRYVVLCTRDPGAEAAYAAGKDIENGTASAEYAADQGVSSDVRNAAIEDDGEILRRERLLRYGSYAALAAAGVACAAGPGSVRIGAGVVAAVNAYLALVNGIPSRAAGVPNDGCNVRCLRHDAGARRLFVQQLRLNAALQRGVRPAQVPAGWAEWHGVPDAADAMQLMQFLFHVSRLLDQGRLHQALADLTAVWEQRSRMLSLLRREVACELTFCAAVLQRQDRVEQAYGPDVARYAGRYRRMMSGKQRLLWAVARYVEHDEARAQALLRELEDRRGSYLMAGEVASDLAIMHALSAGTYPADAPPAGE